MCKICKCIYKTQASDVWVKISVRVQWSWAHLDSFSKAKEQATALLQLPFNNKTLKIFEIANELSRSITDNDDCNDLSWDVKVRCSVCSPYTLKRWHLLCDSVTVPGTALRARLSVLLLILSATQSCLHINSFSAAVRFCSCKNADWYS